MRKLKANITASEWPHLEYIQIDENGSDFVYLVDETLKEFYGSRLCNAYCPSLLIIDNLTLDNLKRFYTNFALYQFAYNNKTFIKLLISFKMYPYFKSKIESYVGPLDNENFDEKILKFLEVANDTDSLSAFLFCNENVSSQTIQQCLKFIEEVQKSESLDELRSCVVNYAK